MSVRPTSAWVPLIRGAGAAGFDHVPAQLGVFQFADIAGAVIYIGYAGGREPFGLRTALAAGLEHCWAEGHTPLDYRYEITHGYLTRWEELLMVHVHDHGAMPVANPAIDRPRGRLNPLAERSTGGSDVE
ncbi:MAG: hypothetical protein AAF467_17020 [Actinomycetota bacterium]